MRAIRFWKPYGVLCQFTDPDGRPNLSGFIDLPGVYAAGRLDADSEGLLILTDDGALNAALTQPGREHEKTYWVQVEGIPNAEALQALRNGVSLRDGLTRPAQVRRIDDPDLSPRDPPVRFRARIPTAWIEIKLTEGKNRQVRRMTAAVGHPTLRLVRWAIGDVNLEGLDPGEWQALEQSKHPSLFEERSENSGKVKPRHGRGQKGYRIDVGRGARKSNRKTP